MAWLSILPGHTHPKACLVLSLIDLSQKCTNWLITSPARVSLPKSFIAKLKSLSFSLSSPPPGVCTLWQILLLPHPSTFGQAKNHVNTFKIATPAYTYYALLPDNFII